MAGSNLVARSIKRRFCLGAPGWLPQLSVQLSLDFRSRHDLTVHEFKPHLGGACLGFSLFLSLPLSVSLFPSLSLSLSTPTPLTVSLSFKINKYTEKRKREGSLWILPLCHLAINELIGLPWSPEPLPIPPDATLGHPPLQLAKIL